MALKAAVMARLSASGSASQRLTYDIEELALLLGVGRNAVYDAVKSGEIPSIVIGKRKVIPKVWLARVLGEPAK